MTCYAGKTELQFLHTYTYTHASIDQIYASHTHSYGLPSFHHALYYFVAFHTGKIKHLVTFTLVLYSRAIVN